MTERRRPGRPSPYQILGVSPYATPEEIRQAYRELARRYHPDANPPQQKARAEAQMRQVNEAYRILGDPVRRSHYDDDHPPPPPATPAPPLEPIDLDQIKVDLRGDAEMRRRALFFWTGLGLAIALVAGGVYYGLTGAENAPGFLRAFGEFVSGQRVLHIDGLLAFTVGELVITLLGIFILAIPLAWLWFRR